MTFIFRNRSIFWDIPKWNRGQTKWNEGSSIYLMGIETNLVEHNRYSIDVINWLGKEFDQHMQTTYR